MKRWLLLLILCISSLTTRTIHAQEPLGGLMAAFPYNASRLLADPVRSRVYAADPGSNGVVVIDTTTLKVVGSVPSGQNPVDLAISPDGNTLYVANAGYVANPGPIAGAVGVVDLNTLSLRASYGLPGPASAIAAGLDGRVYVTAISYEGQESVICQLDGATGTIQTTFANLGDNSGRLQISPDGKTLFDATTYGEPGDLYSFDVSTSTPAPLQTLSRISTASRNMTISHNGEYLGLMEIVSDSVGVRTFTYLLSAQDLSRVFEEVTFDFGEYPQAFAFSADDTLIYQIRGTTHPMLGVFDPQSSASLDEVPVPTLDATDYSDIYHSMVVDNTGTYIFAADSDPDDVLKGAIYVLGTGRGTLKAPLPTVFLYAPPPVHGQEFVIVSRIGDMSQDLTIKYSLGGTAQNGVDYSLLSGKKIIRAGRSNAVIMIDPIVHSAGTTTKTVTVVLQPKPRYQLGEKKAKIELVVGD